MISHDEAQGTLFTEIASRGFGSHASERRETVVRAEVQVGERIQPNPALADRAAFIRYHVGEIVKKLKTVEAHRSKGKTLLARANEVGDTGAGEEARLEFEMADRANTLAEQHYAALIARTRIEP